MLLPLQNHPRIQPAVPSTFHATAATHLRCQQILAALSATLAQFRFNE
jgi:hypothetical protein